MRLVILIVATNLGFTIEYAVNFEIIGVRQAFLFIGAFILQILVKLSFTLVSENLQRRRLINNPSRSNNIRYLLNWHPLVLFPSGGEAQLRISLKMLAVIFVIKKDTFITTADVVQRLDP